MKIWTAGKFGLLLGVFLVLSGLTFWDNGLKDIYARYGGSRVSFYLTLNESLDLKTFSEDILIIKSGGGVIIDAPGAEARELRQGFSDIKGESVSFEGDINDALGVLALYRVKTVSEEEVAAGGGDSIKIIYGYSGLFTRAVNLDGKKVNIQAAVNGATGRVTIGTPLILGSY